jgi:hypothetical protein
MSALQPYLVQMLNSNFITIAEALKNYPILDFLYLPQGGVTLFL